MCWEQDEQKIEENFKFVEGGACQILALHPAVLGSILGVTKNVSLDVAEIYWWHCLELWTDNVNQTHLVMASGKLVLHKSLFNFVGEPFIFSNILSFQLALSNCLSTRWLFHKISTKSIGESNACGQ